MKMLKILQKLVVLKLLEEWEKIGGRNFIPSVFR